MVAVPDQSEPDAALFGLLDCTRHCVIGCDLAEAAVPVEVDVCGAFGEDLDLGGRIRRSGFELLGVANKGAGTVGVHTAKIGVDLGACSGGRVLWRNPAPAKDLDAQGLEVVFGDVSRLWHAGKITTKHAKHETDQRG